MDEWAQGRPPVWMGPRLDLLLAGIALVAGGVAAALALPHFLGMGLRAKRAEVPENVAALGVAELSYRAAFDRFVAVDRSPRASPDKQLATWVPNAGSTELAWTPDGQVRGIYWVELDSDGAHFTVHGRCDVDGDGRFAEYVATDGDPDARRVTDADVY